MSRAERLCLVVTTAKLSKYGEPTADLRVLGFVAVDLGEIETRTGPAALNRSAGGEEELLLLHQVWLQLSAQLGEGAIDHLELGSVGTVDADNGGEHLGDLRQFLTQPLVVDGNDVLAKLSDACVAPVPLFGGQSRRVVSFNRFEQRSDRDRVETATLAGRGEALRAATAVVETKQLEDPDPIRSFGS